MRYAVRISEGVEETGMERTVYGFISVGGDGRSSVGVEELDFLFLFLGGMVIGGRCRNDLIIFSLTA